MSNNLDQFRSELERAVEMATEAGKRAMLEFMTERANAGLEARAAQVPPGRTVQQVQQAARGQQTGLGRIQPLVGIRPLVATNPLIRRAPDQRGGIPPLTQDSAQAQAQAQALQPKASWEKEDLRLAADKFGEAFRKAIRSAKIGE